MSTAEAPSSTSAFVRQSSGLVKTGTPFRTAAMVIFNNGLGVFMAFFYLTNPGVFPKTNLVLALVIADHRRLEPAGPQHRLRLRLRIARDDRRAMREAPAEEPGVAASGQAPDVDAVTELGERLRQREGVDDSATWPGRVGEQRDAKGCRHVG